MRPSFTSGVPEARVVRSDAEMTCERQFTAAAEGKTVHGGDHRAAETFEPIEHALAALAHLPSFDGGRFGQLTDVGARYESLFAHTREDDAAHRGVGIQFRDRDIEFADDHRVQRVEFVRPVDGDDGDAVILPFNEEGCVSHG
jgi:hypothetical protein